MSEHFGRVLVYSLNCDHPQHDRVFYAKKNFSDPDQDEWSVREPTTVAECRRLAKLDGWKIEGGVATCRICKLLPDNSK